MKLSEMSVQQGAKALVRVSASAKAIVRDDAIKQAIKDIGGAEKKTILDQSDVLFDMVPMLLESHFADLANIVSAMTGKTVQQVSEETTKELYEDIQEFMDDELVGFFSSSIRQAMKN